MKERIQRLFSSVKAASFRPYILSTGCCSVEFEAVRTATYDWSRLGIFEVNAPCEADVLVVAGWLNSDLRDKAFKAYQEMKSPRYVIAVGACSLSGSPYYFGEEKSCVASDFLPVDVFVSGCPPRPESLIEAFVQLRRKVHPERDQRMILQEAMKIGPSGQWN